MVKMKFTDNQTAFDYAIYMIASSYFKSASCDSKILERSMLLQYKEQRLDNQYLMEEICIRYMNDLVKKLPEFIFSSDMKVKLKRQGNGQPVEIYFINDKFIIGFAGTYKGRDSFIDYQIWTKKSKKFKPSCIKRRKAA